MADAVTDAARRGIDVPTAAAHLLHALLEAAPAEIALGAMTLFQLAALNDVELATEDDVVLEHLRAIVARTESKPVTSAWLRTSDLRGQVAAIRKHVDNTPKMTGPEAAAVLRDGGDASRVKVLQATHHLVLEELDALESRSEVCSRTVEVLEAGYMGLLEATNRFNPVELDDFEPFARWWIRQSMERAVRRRSA